MIICPNCNHQNPEGSVQCESCYTPLPSTSPCPNCGALVQTDATFCGQCGFNLQGSETATAQAANNFVAETKTTAVNPNELFQSPWDDVVEEVEEPSFPEKTTIPPNLDVAAEEEQLEDIAEETENTADLESWLASMQLESSRESESNLEEIPELFASETVNPEPTIPETSIPEPAREAEVPVAETDSEPEIPGLSISETSIPEPAREAEVPFTETDSEPEIPDLPLAEVSVPDPVSEPEPPVVELEEEPETPGLSAELETTPESTNFPPMTNNPANDIDTSTRLQLQKALLSHVQTGTNLEMPINLPLVRIGKPNNQVPPDIDVSGFPNAEIVSRIHAEIRIEGDTYFIEDRGSSNGTYINHSPLLTGNRHRLRPGDRISLGKGDLMTFIFQVEQL